MERTGVTTQDDIITDLIYSSVAYLEQSLDFIVDTNSSCYQFYDDFGTCGYLPVWHRYITTTANDVVVSYWDGSTWQVFAAASYRIDNASVPNRIILKEDYDWPDLTSDDLNRVRVTFKVDTGVSFFRSLKAAVMTLVAAQYENREGEWNSSIMVSSVKRFIDTYRLPG